MTSKNDDAHFMVLCLIMSIYNTRSTLVFSSWRCRGPTWWGALNIGFELSFTMDRCRFLQIAQRCLSHMLAYGSNVDKRKFQELLWSLSTSMLSPTFFFSHLSNPILRCYWMRMSFALPQLYSIIFGTVSVSIFLLWLSSILPVVTYFFAIQTSLFGRIGTSVVDHREEPRQRQTRKGDYFVFERETWSLIKVSQLSLMCALRDFVNDAVPGYACLTRSWFWRQRYFNKSTSVWCKRYDGYCSWRSDGSFCEPYSKDRRPLFDVRRLFSVLC